MSDIRALVVLYHGECPTDLDIQELRGVLKRCSEANSTATVVALSSEEISAMLAKDIMSKAKHTDAEYSKEEKALIYICTKFQEDLCEKTMPVVRFTAHFSSYVASITFTGADPEMMTAVRIIAENPGCYVRQSIRFKYHINNKVIQAIARVGQYVLNDKVYTEKRRENATQKRNTLQKRKKRQI